MQKCLFYMCKLLSAWGVVKSMAVLPDWASKQLKQISVDMQKGKREES